MKKVYFLSDAHLGSRGIPHARTQERRLVSFLDQIKHHAAAIYFLGDMFDFWWEYHNVVPRGFTRFLGKLSELTDMGVEVHYFTGNHDFWCDDYLRRECGVVLHREPLTCEIYGKEFYLAHGDGLGECGWKFRLLLFLFHSATLRQLFSAIHPRWGVDFGMEWARLSREKRERGIEFPFQGEEHESLVKYSRQYLAVHSEMNFFIYGHRHIMLDLMLARDARMLILGDWITLFSYAVFDGEHLFLEQYVEGESQP